ncbi:hypothetical protein D7Y13_37655 [Corallococcus praedator]|uniref:CARDB domain-containing protein n=1 Tax=Corallococcus praedator TaxID=2316724 RepID=A0ABX9Q5U5_9BACT|nr:MULTISPECIES: CARDB domain-containing protein [Corallococcus]RKH32833.1 hypothetical protein D7X75_14155 [Corallococcus sp. CA031C]RKH92219.1 hypothetical protein D7Y13_37655 [Corallococcus praedator]
MKIKATAASLFLLVVLASNSAWAQVQMNILTAPAAIADPLAGFTVNYTMTGSKSGVGAAAAQVTFYLSASANGSTGVWQLFTQQILLNGSGLGPYFPPAGTQSRYISRLSMQANAVAQLEAIAAACQPQTWYILGRVDSTTIRSTTSVLGTTKPADFYFTGGTITPASIQPGGSTVMTFDLYTRCPANTASRVGIFLTDANYQSLGSIGAVNIGAGAGTSTLPPSTITFSSAIAPGTYHLVLVADVDGVIAESNENNNAGDFTLEVTPSPLAATGRHVGELGTGVSLPNEVTSGRQDLAVGAPGEAIQPL